MWQPAGVPRQLFPPPELLPAETTDVLIVEGEPDAIAAWSAGLIAVGVPGTAGWHPGDAGRFRGPRWTVYVIYDCDDVGRRAGAEVAATLAELAVDVRLIDLDPGRTDGYDLTDYLLERGPDELRRRMAEAELYTGDEPASPIVFEPLRAFLERELPPAEALVGVARGGTNLLPRYGWVMPWGREGSGKTSVLVDLLFHAAAGLEWLGYPIGRPLRLVVIVNEGVPGGFQDKLAAKVDAWPGDVELVLDNLAVYASPWGEFTFRSERMTEHARSFALDFGADYVALDPLHTLGSSGSGTPEETEAFKHVLRAFGLWADIGVLTAHHSNKSGMVSGDWARHPDTVIHLEKDGKNPATKVTLEKARPADPLELGNPFLLEWVVETFGYRRVELNGGPLLADDELLAEVLGELAARTEPVGITTLTEVVGHDRNRVREVVLGALKTGEIRNISTRNDRYALVVAPDASSGSSDEPVAGEQTRIDTSVDVAGSGPAMSASEPIAPEPAVDVAGPLDPGRVQRRASDDDGDPKNEEDGWTF
jgi:hypothetical protein